VAATKGEVTFHTSADDFAYPVMALDTTSDPPEGACSAVLLETTVREGNRHDFSAFDDLRNGVEFRCLNADPQLFRDFRAVARFTDARLLEPVEPAFEHDASCESCPTLGQDCAHYAEPLVRAELIDSEGSAVGYPEFVTSDFARTFLVRLEMARVGDGDEGVCAENINVMAEATFTVTAERYQARGMMQVCDL
jgi:hypothetical protein